jgi:NDP-sugar pyrophosphorylase family protein
MYPESPLFSPSNQKFNVIILAAGLGTRLRPETEFIPKPLIELGGLRAIDHCIRKYQYIAGRMIIAVAYCADLITNYVMGKYSAYNLYMSAEDVASLHGPGTSLMYALDQASSRLPTLITFCDYIVGDQFPVDYDSLGVCRPDANSQVLGQYKTVAVVEEGVVVDLVANPNIDEMTENGFTGIAVFHNTRLLKAITYGAATSKSESEDVDFAFEIIRPYLQQMKVRANPLSQMLEFGTANTLAATRNYLNGDR